MGNINVNYASGLVNPYQVPGSFGGQFVGSQAGSFYYSPAMASDNVSLYNGLAPRGYSYQAPAAQQGGMPAMDSSPDMSKMMTMMMTVMMMLFQTLLSPKGGDKSEKIGDKKSPSGASGSSGSKGSSGSSGSSGSKGASGKSGESGACECPSGASGNSGSSGSSGSSGNSGPSGVSGGSGGSGVSGGSGPSGASGQSGASGPSGASGNSGASGALTETEVRDNLEIFAKDSGLLLNSGVEKKYSDNIFSLKNALQKIVDDKTSKYDAKTVSAATKLLGDPAQLAKIADFYGDKGDGLVSPGELSAYYNTIRGEKSEITPGVKGGNGDDPELAKELKDPAVADDTVMAKSGYAKFSPPRAFGQSPAYASATTTATNIINDFETQLAGVPGNVVNQNVNKDELGKLIVKFSKSNEPNKKLIAKYLYNNYDSVKNTSGNVDITSLASTLKKNFPDLFN